MGEPKQETLGSSAPSLAPPVGEASGSGPRNGLAQLHTTAGLPTASHLPPGLQKAANDHDSLSSLGLPYFTPPASLAESVKWGQQFLPHSDRAESS